MFFSALDAKRFSAFRAGPCREIVRRLGDETKRSCGRSVFENPPRSVARRTPDSLRRRLGIVRRNSSTVADVGAIASSLMIVSSAAFQRAMERYVQANPASSALSSGDRSRPTLYDASARGVLAFFDRDVGDHVQRTRAGIDIH